MSSSSKHLRLVSNDDIAVTYPRLSVWKDGGGAKAIVKYIVHYTGTLKIIFNSL